MVWLQSAATMTTGGNDVCVFSNAVDLKSTVPGRSIMIAASQQPLMKPETREETSSRGKSAKPSQEKKIFESSHSLRA